MTLYKRHIDQIIRNDKKQTRSDAQGEIPLDDYYDMETNDGVERQRPARNARRVVVRDPYPIRIRRDVNRWEYN